MTQKFRSRDKQAFAMAQTMQDDHTPSPTVVRMMVKELTEAEARGVSLVVTALQKLLKALSCTSNAEDPDVLVAEREARELMEKMGIAP